MQQLKQYSVQNLHVQREILAKNRAEAEFVQRWIMASPEHQGKTVMPYLGIINKEKKL